MASRRAASTSRSAVAARRARGLGGGVGLAQLGATGLGDGLQLLDLRRRRRELALQRLELAGQLPIVLGGELGDLRLEVGDARGVVGDGHVLERLGLQGLQATGAPLGALRGLGTGGPHALEALGDPVGGGPRRPDAAGELLAPLRALGQRLLGGLALAGDALERALRAVPRGAGDVRLALGVLQRRVPGAHGVARELPAGLVDLALQALVQLRGLGLALERAQPRARLALDVQRAVEVRLRALQLELGAAAALAVLAEAGGLLDEQPAVARAGGDDRLDAALGHDGVHLLAQAGVAEDLQHVDEAAARAVEPVLAIARAVEPPEDGDLADREVDRAVRVVEDELDLRRRARLHAATAAEDDVLHRLPAHRERRLLAHRPEHRVGDVGLARAVGADDDRHPGPELHARAVRERLEALHRDRPQVHQLAASATGRSSSAARAASCSAAFFERPRPRPTSSSATRATTSKIRSCGGPISSATS